MRWTVTLSQQERDHLLRYYFERNCKGWRYPDFERVCRSAPSND